jgi:folate-binding protein YgfZ
MSKSTALPNRGILEISGVDRVSFLQGLVSNDVTKVETGCAVWAAMLTPQGKWLADFFILSDGERLLLDCERSQIGDIIRRLARFRLRAQIALDDRSESLFVHAAWSDATPGIEPEIIAQAPDPRLPDAGRRVIATAPLTINATPDDWDLHRLTLGLPDGSRDLEAEKTVLLEAGFDELGGVSWSKGCYMGQELTARTKYRGLVKRRLIPIKIFGDTPAPGSAITCAGREVGTMRSVRRDTGLALLRLDALEGELTCGGSSVAPIIPAWMKLPAQAAGK